MNYLISDTEVHALDVLCHQLGFAASMAADAKDGSSMSCTPAELYFFMEAQRKAAEGVLNAVYARHEAAAEGAGMNAALWVHALRVASGNAVYAPAGTEERISRCLANEAATSPDMHQVLQEWCKVLCEGGQQASAAQHQRERAQPATEVPA